MIKPLPSARQAAHIALAFALSTLITALFIRAYGGYVSAETMILSGTIAGGKWAIQVMAGFFLLGNRRWNYISQLATTCLIGSLVLLPFAILSGGANFFFGSLIACILVMTACVVILLKLAGFAWRWSGLWLLLLCIAVTLQLTVVFHIV